MFLRQGQISKVSEEDLLTLQTDLFKSQQLVKLRGRSLEFQHSALTEDLNNLQDPMFFESRYHDIQTVMSEKRDMLERKLEKLTEIFNKRLEINKMIGSFFGTFNNARFELTHSQLEKIFDDALQVDHFDLKNDMGSILKYGKSLGQRKVGQDTQEEEEEEEVYLFDKVKIDQSLSVSNQKIKDISQNCQALITNTEQSKEKWGTLAIKFQKMLEILEVLEEADADGDEKMKLI